MKTSWWALALGLIFFSQPLSAHRLDEYLQASTVAVGRGQLTVVMRLTPGVKVMDAILPALDPNGDGEISEKEQRAYAASVQRDVSVSVDGEMAKPILTTLSFPAIDELKEGSAEIILAFEVRLPPKAGPRRVVFENRHQSGISAYLVNCLQPVAGISILKQDRNFSQSSYQLEFSLPEPNPLAPRVGPRWLSVLLTATFVGVVFFLIGRSIRGSPIHGKTT